MEISALIAAYPLQSPFPYCYIPGLIAADASLSTLSRYFFSFSTGNDFISSFLFVASDCLSAHFPEPQIQIH